MSYDSDDNPEQALEFNLDLMPDLKDLGYECAAAIEFWENPESEEIAFRAFLLKTTLQGKKMEETGDDKFRTNAQVSQMVAVKLFEDYMDRQEH